MPNVVPFEDLPGEYQKKIKVVPTDDLPEEMVFSKQVPLEDLPNDFIPKTSIGNTSEKKTPSSAYQEAVMKYRNLELQHKSLLSSLGQNKEKYEKAKKIQAGLEGLVSPISMGEAVVAPIIPTAMEGATGIASISPQIVGAKKAYDVITGKKTLSATAKEFIDPRQLLNTSKEIIDIGHDIQQSKPVSTVTEFLQPKTEGGKALLEGISYPFEKAHEMAEDAQDFWEAKGHYKTGFINKMLLEAAPFLIPYTPKILKEARMRGTSPVKIIEEIKQNPEIIKEAQEGKVASKEHVAGKVPIEDLPESFKASNSFADLIPETPEKYTGVEHRKSSARESFLKLTPKEQAVSDSLPEGFTIKKVPTGAVNPYGTEKLFRTTSLELVMPDGTTAGGSLGSLADIAKEFNEKVFKDKPATTPQEISIKLGKPNQISVLESIGIKDVAEQKKAIVQDVMRNPGNKVKAVNFLKSLNDKVINAEIKKIGEPELFQEPIMQNTIDQMYTESNKKLNIAQQRGSIQLPSEPIGLGEKFNIAKKFKKVFSDIKEGWDELGFYTSLKKKYPELVNDIRTDIIGGSNHLANLENKINVILWAGLDAKQIKLASDIMYAKDSIGRIKAGKGNPNITLEKAQSQLSDLISKADQNILNVVEKKDALYKMYRDNLVERGKLSPEDLLDDYVRHYTVEYTPDWLPIQSLWRKKLRTPSRGYTKTSTGSVKEYRQDAKSITDYLLEVEADNLIDDFISKQSKKYNVIDKFSDTEKKKMGLIAKHGGREITEVKPGRLYIDSNGEKYWGYNPKKPFSRVLYPLEEGGVGVGGYTKTYLVPEKIYKTFENFSPQGSKAWYAVNRATSLWKEAALTTRFVAYNINNMIGDTYMLYTQHPNPIALSKYIPQSVNFLRNKKNIPHLNEFKKWLSDNDVIGASFIHEIPKLKEGLRGKIWRISETREALLRTANAKYLFDKLVEGKASETIAKFDWIDTHGLTPDKALGKIAREVLIDYPAVSKTYTRLVRGLLAPFGRFYFGGSSLMWKFARKHPVKFAASMSAIPIAAEMFNHRSKEITEAEAQLPDSIRQLTKFVLKKNPDGSTLTLVLQSPQDALIGTKFFTVAYNQAGRVVTGEKSIGAAAKDTLVNWFGKEWRGIVFLQNPMVRFIGGLINDRDPVDKQRVYPIDKNKLSSLNQTYYQGLYFLKTMTPMLSGYITETQGKTKTPKEAIGKVLDDLAGTSALGLKSFTPRDEIRVGNRFMDYDTYSKSLDVVKKDSMIKLSIRDGFIRSGKELKDYLDSEEFESNYGRLRELYNNDKEAIESIDKSIISSLTNPLTKKLWVTNKISRAKTDEEKKELGIERKKYTEESIYEKFKHLPKRTRKFAIGEKQ